MLENFEKNIQSQFGEDGVIEEIFNRISPLNFHCVEFGAWDGIYYSNTWNLWKNHNWSAILIEGDADKTKELIENTKNFTKVKAINAFVTNEGENSVDNILPKYDLPIDFDLLSVDIDGDEYYIFESLNKYRPKVIVIEYNPTIPPQIELVQDKGEYLGSSALALINLGVKKGYKAIHITTTNLFFIANEIFDNSNFTEIDLLKDFKYEFLVNVITSYDGKPFLSAELPYLPDIPKHIKPTLLRSLKDFIKRKKEEDFELPNFTSTPAIYPVKIQK